MNILYVIPIYPPVQGGASVYFKTLLEEFKRKKDIKKLIILTAFAKNAPIYEKDGKIYIFRILISTRVRKNFILNALRFSLSFILSSIIPLLIVPLYQIDIIHIHSFYSNVFAHKLFKLFLIVDCRDLGEKKASDPDIVICASKNILKLQKKIYPTLEDRIRYVPLPFNPPNLLKDEYIKKVKKKYEIPSPYLCFVGDIAKQKGIFELIDGFEIFLREHSEYNLLLIGENVIGQKFFDLIEHNHKIIYLGPLPYMETKAVMQGSELLILPSKSEGLPRTCLEAIALGKKVICPSTVSEFMEYCSDFVIHEITPNKVAGRVEEVLKTNNKPYYPFERHNPQKVADKVYNIYKEVIY